MDNYANYFIQSFIECCTPQQRLLLLEAIKDMVKVAQSPKGTHAI